MSPSIRELREATRSWGMGAMIRRLVVSATSAAGLWQLLGFTGVEGERETLDDVEVFPGVGFASRPRAGKGEVVVVQVGGADHPIVVASRDKEIQVALDEDETAIYSSKARVKITKDGDVQITAAAGRTVTVNDGAGGGALATKAELDALTTVYNAHTHLYAPGPGALVASAVPVAQGVAPTGTTVLRGK